MKQSLLFLFVTLIVSSACGMLPAAEATPGVPPETEPVQDTPAPSATAVTPTEASPEPKLPAASFESRTFINQDAGFALDYPAGWTVQEMVLGPRGTQVQFLSAPELADMPSLPDGATRVTAVVYQWDPKNDLEAYVAHMKTAWEASGFTILEEEELVLDLGLPAVQFTVQTPEAQVIFLVAALGNQYLVVSGEGDLGLVQEIVQRVRPISR